LQGGELIGCDQGGFNAHGDLLKRAKAGWPAVLFATGVPMRNAVVSMRTSR